MKLQRIILIAGAAIAVASVAHGRPVGGINDVNIRPRIFNDRPESKLTITEDYSTFVRIAESEFGPGGFANRHSAYFSDDGALGSPGIFDDPAGLLPPPAPPAGDGATSLDFDYNDAFDICVTVTINASIDVTVEAGIHSDLFGLGYFGQLPNGEIVSFGSVLPFHSFGFFPVAPTITLRMFHIPGDGDGVNPLPVGGQPSTIEYFYDIGGGFVSSGFKPFTNGEGGIPDIIDLNTGLELPFFIGVGAQHNGANPVTGAADTLFTDLKAIVPTPGAFGLLGLAGLISLRRRR